MKIDNRYLTLKEIAAKYNISLQLLRGRYQRGIREIEELIQPKYEATRK
jgi:hypothetical protein